MNNTIRAALVTVIKSHRQKMSRAQRQRGLKPQRWLYPYATEARYATTIRAWLRPMKNFVHTYLKENAEAVLRGDSAELSAAEGLPALRLDAVPGKSFKTMVNSLNGWMGQYVPDDDESKSGSPIYMGLGNIADSVFDFNEGQFEKGAKTALGVEFPVGEDWWPDARENWKRTNYELMRGSMLSYIQGVNAATERAVTSGLPVKELSKQIMALDDKITKGKANFIARDQIGKLNGEITQRRMESVGLTMYEWETSGDERVRSSHAPLDGKLCLWDDSSVYSVDGGKTWKDRPASWCQLHPGQDYQCRCTALAYWQELVGEADEQIDLIGKNEYPIPEKEGMRVMDLPKAKTQGQREENQRILAGRVAANENYVADNYPNEAFISSSAELEKINKLTKGLTLPKNVKIARSRIPVSSDQRDILRKELRQAEILASRNNSVYFIPEHGAYKERLVDAVVNGLPYEFRNITGNARAVEDEFGNAKGKGSGVNVFMNIDSAIPKAEARRRIALVLDRHPEYTGKIIVSFSKSAGEMLGHIRESTVYFWDTKNFR